jgi:diacylglycerol kinase family enzyme
MRALLVVNPWTRSATPRVLRGVTAALASELKLDVEATTRRDHAGELAAAAAADGYDVVAVLGGDGTLNEVVQTVAFTQVRLGVLPGGSTNVFARLLGLGRDPVAAAEVLVRRLRAGRERIVNLGRANHRLFAFCAGWGYDAEVVRMVDGRPRMKRAMRQATFLYCGALAMLRGRANVRGVSVAPDRDPATGELGTVVCCNADPYTYLGPLPGRVCPEADLDAGLDVTALTTARIGPLLRLTATALTSDGVPRLPHVRAWHDRGEYTLTSPAPLPFHVDGEIGGEVSELTLRSVPAALTVVA